MQSSTPAISVRNLSKCYRLGSINRHTLVDEIEHWWHKLRGRDPRKEMGRIGPGTATEQRRIETEAAGEDRFWALKDVSFDIQPGEIVGIIGRNGAGKSTLLKILSRITEPTEGEALIEGRVGSLLEVGTGFHPELTGRENVYLNGAILGMRRAEITAKLDEIIAFAEVEKFIDTPVKRYSSGMYVRLAFAVAAHLEPEILLVDEVLAVGDAGFQKKCLGKMGDVAKAGRTILFVSHNMAAVQQLCHRGVVLSGGQLQYSGSAEEAVRFYIQSATASDHRVNLATHPHRSGSQWLKFVKVEVCDSEGHELNQLISGQDARLRLHYRSEKERRQAPVQVAFNIKTSQGYVIANLNSEDAGQSFLDIYPTGYLECVWPHIQLRSGRYCCTVFCSVNREIVDWVEDAFMLDVIDGDYYRTGRLVHRSQGDVLISHSWVSESTVLPPGK